MVHRNKKFNKVKIFYEHETDTLHIFVGDQRNSVARSVGNGVQTTLFNPWDALRFSPLRPAIWRDTSPS